MTTTENPHDTLNETIAFADESPTSDLPLDFYLIMIVDDNPDVHLATQIALKGHIINNRRLMIINAYSGREAKLMFDKGMPVDLVLLDMVMETPHAGMEVARHIQSRFDHAKTPAIIMRSGQPGMFKDQDIADNIWFDEFMIKSVVTQQHLSDLLRKHLTPQIEDDGVTRL